MSLELWKSIFEYGGVILLFLTFIFGAGAVITTNRLNTHQAEALREFDRNLTDAKTQLGIQQERAAKADELASRMEANNIQLRINLESDSEKVTNLQKYASDAKAAQQRVELELETQKLKRLELATSLLPRRFIDQSGAAERLSKFGPMPVIFEYINEREPRAMAEQIYFVTAFLHWPGVKRKANEDLIEEGVTVSPGAQFPPAPINDAQEFFRWTAREQQQKLASTAAAEALRDALRSSGIDAKIGNAGHDIQSGALLIQVGAKPNHALASTLQELGPEPEPTPIQQGKVTSRLSSNRAEIPEEPISTR